MIYTSINQFFKMENIEFGKWITGIHHNPDSTPIAAKKRKQTTFKREIKIQNKEEKQTFRGKVELVSKSNRKNTMDKMKSDFIHLLLQNDKEQILLNSFCNNTMEILERRSEKMTKAQKYRQFQTCFQKIKDNASTI